MPTTLLQTFTIHHSRLTYVPYVPMWLSFAKGKIPAPLRAIHASPMRPMFLCGYHLPKAKFLPSAYRVLWTCHSLFTSHHSRLPPQKKPQTIGVSITVNKQNAYMCFLWCLRWWWRWCFIGLCLPGCCCSILADSFFTVLVEAAKLMLHKAKQKARNNVNFFMFFKFV